MISDPLLTNSSGVVGALRQGRTAGPRDVNHVENLARFADDLDLCGWLACDLFEDFVQYIVTSFSQHP